MIWKHIYPELKGFWSDMKLLCLSGTWLHAVSAQGVTQNKLPTEYFYGNRADLEKKHAKKNSTPKSCPFPYRK